MKSSRDDQPETSVRRRVGFSVAIVVNAVLLGLVNGWPGWQSVPFLTADAASVITTLNLALGVGIVVSAVNMIVDLRWVRALGEIITSVVALVFLLRVLAVFPFSFSDESIDWALVTGTVLWFAIAGCVISILVSVVVLVREITGASHGDPVRGG